MLIHTNYHQECILKFASGGDLNYIFLKIPKVALLLLLCGACMLLFLLFILHWEE